MVTTEVELIQVAARPFAGVLRATRRDDIPRVLIAGLDVVWPVVRTHARGTLGHNLALYRELGEDRVELECGVEVVPPFDEVGEVRLRWTPAGAAIHARHGGGPETLRDTYAVLHDWLRGHGSPTVTRFWEDYDDVDQHGAILGIDLYMLLPEGVTRAI